LTADPGLATAAPEQLALADVESLNHPPATPSESQETKPAENEHTGPSSGDR
jgi:hypothetical protein